MEPINWIAVVLGAILAVAIGIVWQGPLFRTGRPLLQATNKAKSYAGVFVVMLIGSAMLGHSFARIGQETLAAKPWLYPMQSGGIALAFIIPSIWLTQARLGVVPAGRLLDSLYWLAAYLVIGATFWVLG